MSYKQLQNMVDDYLIRQKWQENKEPEYWLDCVGFEGFYMVSNYGRVKSLSRVVNSKNNSKKTNKGKILKINVRYDGYNRVQFSKNGNITDHYVHLLVLKAFNPSTNNAYQGNHIDEDKSNNFYKNLNWLTPKQNSNHGTRNKRISDSNTVHGNYKATKYK